jgi:hypothetical protein
LIAVALMNFGRLGLLQKRFTKLATAYNLMQNFGVSIKFLSSLEPNKKAICIHIGSSGL